MIKFSIIFFGSSNYCLPVLETLHNHFKLIAIVTKKDQVVEKYAQKHNVKTFTSKDKAELLTLKESINNLQPDLAIVADYGLIIPEAIFDIPKYKSLNIHFSRLPDLRGASPVQHTILREDKSAWITIQLLDKDLDTGDIVWQKEIQLSSNQAIEQSSNETTENLYKKLFNITALELPVIINQYVKKELVPQKQDHSKATYTKILTREDGFIPPKLLNDALKGGPSGVKLERTIRAFSPWPGVWTNIQITNNKKQITRKRLKIHKTHLQPTTYNLQPTTKLVPDLVQLEGKNPVSWKQFKEGYPDFKLK